MYSILGNSGFLKISPKKSSLPDLIMFYLFQQNCKAYFVAGLREVQRMTFGHFPLGKVIRETCTSAHTATKH